METHQPSVAKATQNKARLHASGSEILIPLQQNNTQTKQHICGVDLTLIYKTSTLISAEEKNAFLSFSLISFIQPKESNHHSTPTLHSG